MITCKFCGKNFTRACGCAQHETLCELNPNKRNNLFNCRFCGAECKGTYLKQHEECCLENPSRLVFVCQFCGRISSTRSGHIRHERECKLNPDRRSQSPGVGWSKGLTKETDTRVAKCAQRVKESREAGNFKPSWLGRQHTAAQKQRISEKMRGNTNNNPDKTGRGKKGWYKGFFCASTYELAFVIYCLDHNIPIKKFTEYYSYEYQGKQHKYYPDFIIHDTICEIKGFWTELVDVKTSSVTDRPIKVLYRKDLREVFDYIKATYDKEVDKNISDLYE